MAHVPALPLGKVVSLHRLYTGGASDIREKNCSYLPSLIHYTFCRFSTSAASITFSYSPILRGTSSCAVSCHHLNAVVIHFHFGLCHRVSKITSSSMFSASRGRRKPSTFPAARGALEAGTAQDKRKAKGGSPSRRSKATWDASIKRLRSGDLEGWMCEQFWQINELLRFSLS